MQPIPNTRALAAQVIQAVLTEGRSLTHVLPDFKNKCKNMQDAAFLQAMVYGVIRWYPRLAFLCHQLLKKPLKQKDCDLQYLITVGLFQLSDMHVAPHAVISETVEAARVFNKPWATGLINGVLRSYQRQRETLDPLVLKNEIACYAHPKWLIESIRTAWPQHWKDILEANNAAPPFSCRVNLSQITRADYLQQLMENDLLAEPILATSAGITLKTAIDVMKLPGFSTGLCSVQDGGAQFAVPLLELAPRLRVLDACAAPGGKTAHLLEMEPTLAVTAVDIQAERTQRITENLSRLQLRAKVITADINEPAAWWDGQAYDRILLDTPCSASGVIRRHPDIKYLRKLSDITKLAQQQLQLLQSVWPLLKPEGLLVYVTCSIFPAENSEVIQKFLTQQTDASLSTCSIPIGLPQTLGHQILPGQESLDGFYYACLRKSS